MVPINWITLKTLKTGVEERKVCELGGVVFPIIKAREVPAGVCGLPVTVFEGKKRRESTVVAGTVGMTATMVGGETSFQPRVSWWMLDMERKKKN